MLLPPLPRRVGTTGSHSSVRCRNAWMRCRRRRCANWIPASRSRPPRTGAPPGWNGQPGSARRPARAPGIDSPHAPPRRHRHARRLAYVGIGLPAAAGDRGAVHQLAASAHRADPPRAWTLSAAVAWPPPTAQRAGRRAAIGEAGAGGERRSIYTTPLARIYPHLIIKVSRSLDPQWSLLFP
jgi:hypothetical protein